MRRIAVAVLCAVTCVAVVSLPAAGRMQGSRSTAGRSHDWPLNNADVGNTGYSALDEIKVSNAGKLTTKWTFTLPEGESAISETPVVVDGVMYFNSGSKLFALDASTGRQRWMSEVQPSFKGGGRGPAYGDGRVYAFGPATLFAVDAETGKPVESFGEKGLLRIINKALDFKDRGKYAADVDPATLGYSMTTAPMYHGGTLYVGVPFSDSLIAGGLLVAADGRTGNIKWVFRTVPQGPQDDGWDLAKDTWRGDHRLGGGIWSPPAIDAELGRLYVTVGNPTPNYDGS